METKVRREPVEIVGMSVPFFDLVILFVKCALAFVPAAVILATLFYTAYVALSL